MSPIFRRRVSATRPKTWRGALARQGMELADFEDGDAILVRTGWGARFWTSDPENPRNDRASFFELGSPGLSIRAGRWLINRKPVLVAADNGGISGPAEPPFNTVPGIGHHIYLLNGVYMLENIDLEVLAKDAAARNDYTFLFLAQPLKIRGGTGSTVAPVAVR
jgi:kynurenine formamidase